MSTTLICTCRRRFTSLAELDEHLSSGDCPDDPGSRLNYDDEEEGQ